MSKTRTHHSTPRAPLRATHHKPPAPRPCSLALSALALSSLALSALWGCDDAPAAQGEGGGSAGISAGVSAGVSAGTTAGTAAGTAAGVTSGTSAGVTAGVTAGTAAGVTAGAGAGGEPAPPCGLEPSCPRGYRCAGDPQSPLATCQAPISRSCAADGDCREEERCVEGVCWLDPSSLTLELCAGEEGRAGCGEAPRAAPLLAGARSVSITPLGFETPKPMGLDGAQMSFSPPFSTPSELWNDCGYDGLCPGDEGYEGPDEGEGDGEAQGAFIAGFSHGRPAQYCPAELIGCDRPECCASRLAHDDLKAQVVALRQGARTVVFVVLDALGFFHTEVERLRRALRAEGLGVDLLVVSSTHTHESFDTVGQYGAGAAVPLKTGVDPHHMSHLRAQVLEGVRGALADLRPAEALAAVIDEGVEGLGVSDSRPPYIIDDNLPLLLLREQGGGATIAVMMSVANHPETLWSENPYLSADYIHFARRYLEGGLPETAALSAAGEPLAGAAPLPALEGFGGVAWVSAGALGGLLTPRRGAARRYSGEEVREESFDKADALGQRLAAHALQARERGALTPVGAGLSFARQRLLVPVANPTFLLGGFALRLFSRDIYNAVFQGGLSFTPDLPRVMSEVAAVRLGDVTLFTAPGEPFSELLVGGYPGRGSAQSPTIGDALSDDLPLSCDAAGLPAPGGALPCVVSPGQVNPPDFTLAPEGPYAYDLAGPRPFFIGLGLDFLGYIVPEYDFKLNADGAHYEETNSASGALTPLWRDGVYGALRAVGGAR